MLPLSPAGRRYGYVKDPVDTRDLRPQFVSAARSTPLLDCFPWFGPVFDQGQQGSCTANAGSGDGNFLVRRYPQYIPGLQGLDPRSVIFSRSYLYAAERTFDGDPTQDGGSTGRTCCRVMNGKSSDVKFGGICLESTMPYSDQDFTTMPNEAQIAEAKRFQFGAYHRLTAADVIPCLNSGYPVLMGFAVYSSFESQDVARSGLVPLPNKSQETMLGGHEVLIGGHNAGPAVGSWPTSTYKVRNSWGASWGAGGNFYVTDEFIHDPDLCWDFWMIHLGKAWQ